MHRGREAIGRPTRRWRPSTARATQTFTPGDEHYQKPTVRLAGLDGPAVPGGPRAPQFIGKIGEITIAERQDIAALIASGVPATFQPPVPVSEVATADDAQLPLTDEIAEHRMAVYQHVIPGMQADAARLFCEALYGGGAASG